SIVWLSWKSRYMPRMSCLSEIIGLFFTISVAGNYKIPDSIFTELLQGIIQKWTNECCAYSSYFFEISTFVTRHASFSEPLLGEIECQPLKDHPVVWSHFVKLMEL
ncbi:hypothetical protein PENTCL1PPCAC_14361, partial [Pristionchus entomophagus]